MSQTESASATGVSVLEGSSLLDQVLDQSRLKQSDEGYDTTRKGVAAFVAEMLKPNRAGEKLNTNAVDSMIADLDRRLSAQIDQILHAPAFQSMESSWRGIKYLVDKTDFRENTKIELLNVSKDDLLADFEDSPEVVKSGLYRHVYTEEFGQFGGEPVATIIANYDFGPGAQDVKLLQYTSSVSAMSHAPFIAAASPEFFGVERFDELPELKDIASILEGPKYAKWNGFRESEDSRYVGLTMPRFMLRTPYGKDNPVRSFEYQEEAGGKTENYSWGNTAFAFAAKLNDSFAQYRWTPNIVGPASGGAVNDLPVHTYEAMGQTQSKVPTEALVSDRREYELAEAGFIALTMRKGSDNAAFFSANSVQKPKSFGNSAEGKEAETNYKLGTQLPYMFVINRLAHYIKVLQRENIGSWKTKNELNTELNKWIMQYVADQDNPSTEVRSRKPLRKASILVEDVEGDPGWYRVSMSVQPHFKYMGADFTLSLKGKLDKA